jgi:hypothetical protein
MRFPFLFVCLAAITSGTIALAQNPVAYVYVGEDAVQTPYSPIYAFAASSGGKLTALKGSPFTQAENTGLMLGTNGSHFIFMGQGPNGEGGTPYNYLYSYNAGADGVLGPQVSLINTGSYSGTECSGSTIEQARGAELDHTGQLVYVYQCDNAVQTFTINHSTGALNFQNVTVYSDPNFVSGGVPRIAGNNTYAYNTQLVNSTVFGNTTGLNLFARQSDGSLVYKSQASVTTPQLPSNYFIGFTSGVSDPFLQPWFDPRPLLTNDPTNHFAAEVNIFKYTAPSTVSNQGCALASFTMSSSGSLTSTNTLAQMPQGNCGNQMLLSPSGKILVVKSFDGNLYFFNFNRSAPLTRFASVINKSGVTATMAWDSAGHLYALNALSGRLHVYSVTSTKVVEAAGSPYDLPFCGVDPDSLAPQCPQTLIVRSIPQ